MSQLIISPEQLQKLLREFKEQHGESLQLTALGYFGSYARGEASPNSDLDIVFKTDYLIAVLTRMKYRLIVKTYELQGFHKSRCTSYVQEPL